MRRILAVFALASTLLVSGCRKKPEPPKEPPKPKGPPTVSQDTLSKYRPNEAGAVMVVMYHRFKSDEGNTDLNRQPNTFRKDLETLHAKNYYPVNAIDLVQNTMDVPAGKTPVVLTFDDALPTQFSVIEKDGESRIDPDCAIGIMETFSKAHADWPLRGTFFVLPKEGRNGESFGQAESVADKLSYLVSKGYEIANHTSTHSSMRSMKADKVEWELATAKHDIQQIEPKAQMDVLALPYGKIPRDAAAKKALLSGSSGGTSYEHKAVFLAAWRPILSPLTKADKKITMQGSIAIFDKTGLERVTPDARHTKTPGTLEYWISYFEKNPSVRYISDGDATVAAVPVAQKNSVDAARAKAEGKVLQFYGGAKGKNGGLSVG